MPGYPERVRAGPGMTALWGPFVSPFKSERVRASWVEAHGSRGPVQLPLSRVRPSGPESARGADTAFPPAQSIGWEGNGGSWTGPRGERDVARAGYRRYGPQGGSRRGPFLTQRTVAGASACSAYGLYLSIVTDRTYRLISLSEAAVKAEKWGTGTRWAVSCLRGRHRSPARDGSYEPHLRPVMGRSAQARMAISGGEVRA